jgi:hypothetical protein
VPVLLGVARVQFSDAKLKVDASRDVVYATRVTNDAVPADWSRGVKLDVSADDLQRVSDAREAVQFAALPPAASQPRSYSAWAKEFSRYVGQAERLEILRHPTLKIASRGDETERDFRIRVQLEGRVARDAAVEAVRRKYAPKQAALAERLRRAEASLGREQEQASEQKAQAAVSLGATVLGALLGRKAVSTGTIGRATTTARGVGRSMKEASDVKRATETVAAVRQQMRDLEDQAAADAAAIGVGFDVGAALEPVEIAPKRGQIDVRFVALGWMREQEAPAR